jgi:hypothetical protein
MPMMPSILHKKKRSQGLYDGMGMDDVEILYYLMTYNSSRGYPEEIQRL